MSAEALSLTGASFIWTRVMQELCKMSQLMRPKASAGDLRRLRLARLWKRVTMLSTDECQEKPDENERRCA
jgi:hypothetical protein